MISDLGLEMQNGIRGAYYLKTRGMRNEEYGISGYDAMRCPIDSAVK